MLWVERLNQIRSSTETSEKLPPRPLEAFETNWKNSETPAIKTKDGAPGPT